MDIKFIKFVVKSYLSHTTHCRLILLYLIWSTLLLFYFNLVGYRLQEVHVNKIQIRDSVSPLVIVITRLERKKNINHPV